MNNLIYLWNFDTMLIACMQQEIIISSSTISLHFDKSQGKTVSYKLSPNLRIQPKQEEDAIEEEDYKLFNQLNKLKIQKILCNIVKLPDVIPVKPKNVEENQFFIIFLLLSCFILQNQQQIFSFQFLLFLINFYHFTFYQNTLKLKLEHLIEIVVKIISKIY